ncbi:prepilin leader peptidase PilD, partial [Candidatus Gastranaerophilus sp. (ex Termes propinquus)]
MIITDFKERVVFDWHTYPVIALGLAYNALSIGDVTVSESIWGIIGALLFFEIAARLGYLFAPTRAFGEGDTIIAMGFGAFFGWKILIYITIASILLQAA